MSSLQVILIVFAFKKLLMGFHICEETTWDYWCHPIPPIACYSCVEIISVFAEVILSLDPKTQFLGL